MGLLLGAWNGWWVAYRKVPSFIVTLAGMLAFRGILIGITNGTTVSPTSPAMSQIGQSYLPDGIGFGIGVAVGMAVFIVWQWRGRMRRQALGLATSSSTAAVGRQAITAVIVLGAIWLLNDYRGVPTPVLILAALLLAGLFHGHPHTPLVAASTPSAATWRRPVCPGLTSSVPSWRCLPLTA